MAYFDTKYTFRLGELYCGPGGLAYGALHAHSRNGLLDVQHVWANDVDPDISKKRRAAELLLIRLLDSILRQRMKENRKIVKKR